MKQTMDIAKLFIEGQQPRMQINAYIVSCSTSTHPEAQVPAVDGIRV